ncbi:hypothetical protein IQ06DRAFT_150057 [Phaeosphaeriaceae sp. SRC1lsM3a]|nr:hypothetical protein IQ06DRAFT_150057 [Stagonospora sp. SRC1lsM3a]
MHYSADDDRSFELIRHRRITLKLSSSVAGLVAQRHIAVGLTNAPASHWGRTRVAKSRHRRMLPCSFFPLQSPQISTVMRLRI